MHICAPHVCLLAPLGLGLWMVVSHFVGAGKRTQVHFPALLLVFSWKQNLHFPG